MKKLDKLPNAPLQEVIFEVLWELQEDEAGMIHDDGFDLAQGVFARHAKAVLPHHERILPENIPFRITPSIVHRFWKGKGEWPLVQLGHGILAVNDTEKNYVWAENYFPFIKDVMSWLKESYENPLAFKKASLRYIDAIALEKDATDLVEFVNKHYKFGINTEFDTMGAPIAFMQRQSFSLEELGILHVSMSNGKDKQNRPAIVWEIAAVAEQFTDEQAVIDWLNAVHVHTSQAFKDMIKPSLYERFK